MLIADQEELDQEVACLMTEIRRPGASFRSFRPCRMPGFHDASWPDNWCIEKALVLSCPLEQSGSVWLRGIAYVFRDSHIGVQCRA